MTQILTHTLALITGFTICSVLSWSVHRRHKQAWQKEYRRLMGGIKKARMALVVERRPRSLVNHYLIGIFNGEDITDNCK